MNLGARSQFTLDERHAYRVYAAGPFSAPRVLSNIFAAPQVGSSGCSTARRMYASRADSNRLVHLENGNTMVLSCVRPCGPSAYMSSKTRNRLAHALNGNTARQMTPQEQ